MIYDGNKMNRKNCVFLPFTLFAIASKRNVNTVKHSTVQLWSTVNRLTVFSEGIVRRSAHGEEETECEMYQPICGR